MCSRCVFKISCQISIYYEKQNSCFLTFRSENLRPPLISLFPSLGWELEKMTSFSQKYRTGWNYNNNACRKLHEFIGQSFCYSYANFYANCYYNFNPKINGGRKFLEIKVQKTWVILFVIGWNCVRKCNKMGITNLIIVFLRDSSLIVYWNNCFLGLKIIFIVLGLWCF